MIVRFSTEYCSEEGRDIWCEWMTGVNRLGVFADDCEIGCHLVVPGSPTGFCTVRQAAEKAREVLDRIEAEDKLAQVGAFAPDAMPEPHVDRDR